MIFDIGSKRAFTGGIGDHVANADLCRMCEKRLMHEG